MQRATLGHWPQAAWTSTAARVGWERMRLSEWRAAAPTRDAMTLKVVAVIEPVIGAMGSRPDPHCWVAWGDDPSVRYTVFLPLPPGLVACSVRVNVPGEGPRASAKLIRWPRVQVGELIFETQGGHRIASFQLEQQVLRAADAQADRIARFGLAVLAAIDGRAAPDLDDGRGRRAPGRAQGAKRAPTKVSSATKVAGARRTPVTTDNRPAAGSTTPGLGNGTALTAISAGRTKRA